MVSLLGTCKNKFLFFFDTPFQIKVVLVIAQVLLHTDLFIHLDIVCLSPSLAGIYRELCLESVKNKYDCEIQAACQHWEVGHTV